MNTLHEPWDDGAASDDVSWGLPQQLASAAAADAEADAVESAARNELNAVRARAPDDAAAIAAAEAEYENATKALQQVSGLCKGPMKAITLPPMHRNPPVSRTLLAINSAMFVRMFQSATYG